MKLQCIKGVFRIIYLTFAGVKLNIKVLYKLSLKPTLKLTPNNRPAFPHFSLKRPPFFSLNKRSKSR